MTDPSADAALEVPAVDVTPREVAVIDVGSNSVRLVLYRLEGRAVWTVFNEKVLAGLGRSLPVTGRLSEDGVRISLGALRRYRAVLDAAQPDETIVLGTAAVREAADGLEFCERVAAETGLKVRVLSGQEEARYAAMGVLAGAPRARGIAADLGGASLELTRINETGIEAGVTLALGPFALASGQAFNARRVAAAIRERLAPQTAALGAEVLHAVGGGWRSLALVHMQMADHPLRIIHQYAMSAAEALAVARLVAHQSVGSIERIPGVSRKRAETLPYAALVLEGLIEQCGFESVSFSAWGLREGALFESMTPEVRDLDPLVAGCAALGVRHGVTPALPGALVGWLSGLFAKLEPVFGADRDPRLLAAGCALADVGARLHPDHRADLAFAQVLRAPVPGQTHAERAFLACAINARYGGGSATSEPVLVKRLLDERRRKRARAIGLAIRLGCDLSGRSPELLANARLTMEGSALHLATSAEFADLLLGEQTTKRAQALANALGVKLRIERD